MNSLYKLLRSEKKKETTDVKVEDTQKPKLVYHIQNLVDEYLTLKSEQLPHKRFEEPKFFHASIIHNFGEDKYAVGIETMATCSESSSCIDHSMAYFQVEKKDDKSCALKDLKLPNKGPLPLFNEVINVGQYVAFCDDKTDKQTVHFCAIDPINGLSRIAAIKLDGVGSNDKCSLYPINKSSSFLVRVEHQDRQESFRVYQFDGKTLNRTDTLIDHALYDRGWCSDGGKYIEYDTYKPTITNANNIAIDLPYDNFEDKPKSLVYNLDTKQTLTVLRSDIHDPISYFSPYADDGKVNALMKNAPNPESQESKTTLTRATM